LALGLSDIAFIMLSSIPSNLSFFRGFIMKSCWILSKFFFCVYWEDHVVFVLDSVYLLYYIYRFMYVEPILNLWNEMDLVMVYDLSDVVLKSVCSILLRIFASIFINDAGL
jgi:hypothetical protein